MRYQLRIELALFSVFFLIVVVRSVNRKKMQLKYSLMWIVLAVGSGIVALFPQIAINISRKLHFETPSNFIFLVAIIALLGISFSLTLITSKQSVQIKALVQSLSLHEHDNSIKGIEKQQNPNMKNSAVKKSKEELYLDK